LSRQRLNALPNRLDLLWVSLSMPTRAFLAALIRINSSSFACIAELSRFCEFWIRNTIRKVAAFVQAFMTNCQVSEKEKMGPVTIQGNRVNDLGAIGTVARPAQDAWHELR
jgi:hypothetical protein